MFDALEARLGKGGVKRMTGPTRWHACANKACHKCQIPHLPSDCTWCGVVSICAG